jgi:hypothetical protein
VIAETLMEDIILSHGFDPQARLHAVKRETAAEWTLTNGGGWAIEP